MEYQAALQYLLVPYYYPNLPPIKVDDKAIFDDSKCLNDQLKTIISAMLKMVNIMCEIEKKAVQSKNCIYILRCKEFGPALSHMSKSYKDGWKSYAASDYKPQNFANSHMATGRYVDELCFKIQKTLAAIAAVKEYLKNFVTGLPPNNEPETDLTKASMSFTNVVLSKCIAVDAVYTKPSIKPPDSDGVYEDFCDYELYRLLGHIYGAMSLYISGLMKCITSQTGIVDGKEAQSRLELVQKYSNDWYLFNNWIQLYYEVFSS
ncbi:protein ORF1 [Lake sturgeon herpesvirus]|nr:protein ORF1 [Lake sturgeon herpesvirus]